MRAVCLVLVLGVAGCITTTTPPAGSSGASSGSPAAGGDPGSAGGEAGGSASASSTPGSIGSEIDHVGLDFDGFKVAPVLLLNQGIACNCLNEDLDAVTVAELQARRPKAFGQWRTDGTKTEVYWGTRWSKLAFNPPGLPLGDEWRSANTYESTTSIGDSASGTWAGASKEITFDETGHFKFAGAAATNVSAGTSKSRGTYSVKGWMMTLQFEDGTEHRVSASTSADEPNGVLWLSGAAYTQPK